MQRPGTKSSGDRPGEAGGTRPGEDADGRLPEILEAHVIEREMDGGFFTTTVDALANWSRKNSFWPLPLGLSCCAIEFMATVSSRYDLARFGAEVVRHSPRQADLLLVAGTLTYKMASAARRVYDQMPEPKWVVAMGACAASGGMFRTYSTVQGIDEVMPVDFYISGCPPRPEAVIDCLLKLQDQVGRGVPSARIRQAA